MRIAIWAGGYGYWPSVHPDNLTSKDATQMGGSEASSITIATYLAARGHDVLLGCKVPNVSNRVDGRLRVIPAGLFATAVFTNNFDALVSWDSPDLFRLNLEHIPKKVLCFQLNDTQIGVYDYVIDRYLHPSAWHAERFRALYGVPEKKQTARLTNGADMHLISALADNAARPARTPTVIWASSPDRGLHHLLRIWPAIRKECPEATLHVYYDMDKWLSIITANLKHGRTLITTERALEVRDRILPLINEGSVVYHGGVSLVEVLSAMLSAKVLAYPCDPVAPTEGFSMTVCQAWACGTKVVVSDADAFGELWSCRDGITVLPLPIDDDLWTETIVKALSEEEAWAAGELRPIPEEFTYDYIVQEWEKVLG